MAEASWPTIITHRDSYILYIANLSKELVDSVFTCVKAKVTAENRVRFSSDTARRPTQLGFLARELYLNLSIIEPEAIRLIKSLLSVGAVRKLYKADAFRASL